MLGIWRITEPARDDVNERRDAPAEYGDRLRNQDLHSGQGLPERFHEHGWETGKIAAAAEMARVCAQPDSGASRDRTGDLLLAKRNATPIESPLDAGYSRTGSRNGSDQMPTDTLAIPVRSGHRI